MEKTWEGYRSRGVVFLGVNTADSTEGASQFVKDFSIGYANVRDATGAVTRTYRVTGLPTTFFISRDGRVVRKFIGPIREELLTAYIGEIMR